MTISYRFFTQSRLVTEIESQLHDAIPDPIEICLDFSDVDLPDDPIEVDSQIKIGEPTILIDPVNRTAVVKFPQQFFKCFVQPDNYGEQLVVQCIARSIYGLIDNPLPAVDEVKLRNLINDTIGNSGMRILHVFVSGDPVKTLQRRHRLTTVFLSQPDYVFYRLRLSDGCRPSRDNLVVTSKKSCNKFLKCVVKNVWNQIREQLTQYDRLSVIRYVLEVHEGILYDRDYWNDMALAYRSFYSQTDDVYSIAQNREKDRSNSGLAARVVMEMAICECPESGGRRLSRSKLDELLARVALLIETASHSDALNNGFIEPKIQIQPNGEFVIDKSYIDTIIEPFAKAYHKQAFEEAASEYTDLYHYEPLEERKKSDDSFSYEMRQAFGAEFGLSLEEAIDGVYGLLDLAIETDSIIVETTLGDLLELLTSSRGLSNKAAQAFIRTFSIFHRTSWESPPSGFTKTDIYPWRLGRRLSVISRPILVLGPSDSHKVIFGVGTLKVGISLFLSRIEQGHLHTEMYNSAEMRRYIGNVNNELGHNFAKSVAAKYKDMGWHVRNEVQMTELGAPAKFGDIDVLAWNSKGETRIIECKRLRLAKTVVEIAEICKRFRGDAEDALSRHLNRVNWITKNPNSLRHITRSSIIPELIDHRIITNVLVPMTYIDSLPIESEKIGPLECFKD